MQVAVSEAKAMLLELVRKAEAGDEIALTRHGVVVARLVPPRPSRVERLAILESLLGVGRDSPGPDAARSQDFLYDEDGLPR